MKIRELFAHPQCGPAAAMTPVGVIQRYRWDPHSVVRAKAVVRSAPQEAKNWASLGGAFCSVGYREAGVCALREAERMGGLGALTNYERTVWDQFAQGAELTCGLDNGQLRFVRMLLGQFGSPLPLPWFHQFMLARFQDLSPFVPGRQSDGQTVHAAGACIYVPGMETVENRAPVNVLAQSAIDSLLTYLFTSDPLSQCEAVKNNLRTYPQNLLDWRTLARSAVQDGDAENADRCWGYLASRDATLVHEEQRARRGIVRAMAVESAPPSPISAILTQYFQTLRTLSDPAKKLLLSTEIDFPTNESLYHRAMDEGPLSIAGIGGVYIGTGAGLALTHMTHQQATYGFVVDYNRSVTEVVIPAVGVLLMGAKSPLHMVSRLFAVPMPIVQEIAQTHAALADVVTLVSARAADVEYSEQLVNEVITALSPCWDASERNALVRVLLTFMHEQLTSWLLRGSNATLFTAPGGLLSCDATALAAQRLWCEGRIIGVSADWTGGVLSRIAQVIRQQGHQVGVLYLSNILGYCDTSSKPNGAQRIGKKIGRLPLAERSRVVVMERGGQSMLRYATADLVRLLSGASQISVLRGIMEITAHPSVLSDLLSPQQVGAFRARVDSQSWASLSALSRMINEFGRGFVVLPCDSTDAAPPAPDDAWRIAYLRQRLQELEI